MLRQMLFGCGLSFVTTLVHASGMMLAVQVLRVHGPRARRSERKMVRAALIASLVVIMFLASLAESTIWAGVYVRLGALPRMEEALYFSMVTFTTLGYGDVVLSGGFRLIAAFQAATGTIMFGWTAAIIFAFVQRVYFSSGSETPGVGRSSDAV